jgi:hypothetical protein
MRSTRPRPASARRSTQDANIIVGATFDESLEGIIRVSVVATGIDHVAAAAPRPAPDNRLAELTNKLRADTQRLAERTEQQPTRAAPAVAAQPPQGQHACSSLRRRSLPNLDTLSNRPRPRRSPPPSFQAAKATA